MRRNEADSEIKYQTLVIKKKMKQTRNWLLRGKFNDSHSLLVQTLMKDEELSTIELKLKCPSSDTHSEAQLSQAQWEMKSGQLGHRRLTFSSNPTESNAEIAITELRNDHLVIGIKLNSGRINKVSRIVNDKLETVIQHIPRSHENIIRGFISSDSDDDDCVVALVSQRRVKYERFPDNKIELVRIVVIEVDVAVTVVVARVQNPVLVVDDVRRRNGNQTGEFRIFTSTDGNAGRSGRGNSVEFHFPVSVLTDPPTGDKVAVQGERRWEKGEDDDILDWHQI